MIDYFSANLWQLWALVCIVCLILELTSGDFFIMCFSLGAIAAAIVAGCGLSFHVQVIVWVACSALCLLFVRPFALKYLHRNDQSHPSNADALMGREGIVTDAIEQHGHGRVKIDGDSWKAVASNHEATEAGSRVKVVGRESIIISVEKI